MIEADFTKLQDEAREIKGKVASDESSLSEFEKGWISLRGVYVDCLVLRDLISKFGARELYFMSPYDVLRLMSPRMDAYRD
jgi:hypothetical protein